MVDAATSDDAHNFLQVARLVPLSQQVITVTPDTTVREALDIMGQQGFDQLPVAAGDQVIGIFSYRSLAKSLIHVRRNDDPLDLPVLDASEDMAFVHAGDDVSIVLDRLERDAAVGVGDPSRLDAVMTSADVTRFLWQATRPFVLLQDIELAARSLMRRALGDGIVTADAFARALPPARMAGEDAPRTLEELALGELLSVLLQGQSYGQLFSTSFGMSKPICASALEPVRDIRNKVFHFRDEVTVEELDILVAARQYLRRRVQAAKVRPT